MDSLSFQRWREFADMDLLTAEHLLNTMRPTPYEIICYLCQQSAEKYLKGYLIMRTKEDPPYIHDLSVLCKLCEKVDDKFSDILDTCSELTVHSVKPKYPSETIVELSDAQRAIQNANSIKKFLQTQARELFEK